jgi:hypothetical protein
VATVSQKALSSRYTASYGVTQNTIKKRLAFARENRTRSWRNVMFTDRKRFLLSHPRAKVMPVSWVLKGFQQLGIHC